MAAQGVSVTACKGSAAASAEDRPPGEVVVLPDAYAVPQRLLLAWMFRFLRPVRWHVFVACTYLVLGVVAEVLAVRQTGRAANFIQTLHPGDGKLGGWINNDGHAPLSARHVIDALLGRQAGFSSIIAGLVLITAAILALKYLRTVAETRMSMTMVYYIREGVYDKLQRVGFGFHDALSSGQLINRSLTDLQNVRVFVQSAVLSTLEIGLIVAGYIVLIFFISPWVALLALLPLPLWTFYILRFSRRVQPAAKAVMEAEDRNVSLITENIAGVHVVKAFATEAQEVAKYDAHCETYIGKVRRRIRLFADFTPVIRSIASGSYLTLFLAAGVLMIRGRLLAGDFLVLGQAMAQILTRLQVVSTINEQYQNAMVSARRLYEVLHAPPTVPEKPAARPLPPGPGTVRFEGVTFGYNPEKPNLHDVSFEAPGGSIVAIVGPTGAGKTTLVNLISRFYDPQGGGILIDGLDVRDVTLASLRTQVAFVFQETYLFSATVGGNIEYGRPGITAGEIEAAARLAQAHEFIDELPRRYETMLGERGASLSGGQRQRLAIARAIVTNPRVLILDDATASVDPHTEQMIRRAMRFVMHGRTTFVIAHRVSTVKAADLVVVLEHGAITQIGTHEQLMRADGHYRMIASVQLYGDDALPETSDPPSHMDRVAGPHGIGAAAATAGTLPHDREAGAGLEG